MQALAEIQVIPLGVGVSVRKEVEQAHEILVSSGLGIQAHAEGAPRISTNVKIGTRTDKEPALAGRKL